MRYRPVELWYKANPCPCNFHQNSADELLFYPDALACIELNGRHPECSSIFSDSDVEMDNEGAHNGPGTRV